jgi:fatty acyl-CoA reductase
MSASTETSAIAEFFKRKSIFITGATGFIGKQLVEKLVRSCPGRNLKKHLLHLLCFFLTSDFEHIYLLVRQKRGHNPNDRLKELLSGPVSFKIK